MSTNKLHLWAEGLFWPQIPCGIAFGLLWAHQALSSVQGTSAVMMGLVLLYCVLQGLLAIAAHKRSPTKTSKRTIGIYGMWFVLVGLICIAIVINGSYKSDDIDGIMLAIGVIGASVIIGMALSSRLEFDDPMIKGLLAMLWKSMPQLLFAWKILEQGGQGTPLLVIVLGNINIWLRLGQLRVQKEEAGAWNRPLRWAWRSEWVNAATWFIPSCFWFRWWFMG